MGWCGLTLSLVSEDQAVAAAAALVAAAGPAGPFAATAAAGQAEAAEDDAGGAAGSGLWPVGRAERARLYDQVVAAARAGPGRMTLGEGQVRAAAPAVLRPCTVQNASWISPRESKLGYIGSCKETPAGMSIRCPGKRRLLIETLRFCLWALQTDTVAHPLQLAAGIMAPDGTVALALQVRHPTPFLPPPDAS